MSFAHHKTESAVKKGESVSDKMSYMALRSGWCNIVLLNVHAPSEEKSDDSKDSLYEEFEQVFNHFPKYYMKILVWDFNAIFWRDDIFKTTVGNES